jgi:hypothetical protein
MDLEMAPTAGSTVADKRRRGAVLRSRQPFHLRLPDVTPSRRPRPAPPAPAVSPAGADIRMAAHDPVATARARISKRRYDTGHRHVTGMIDRLRDRRRRLFGRLWIASVVLTALSIVALVVEVIQNVNAPQTTTESVLTAGDSGHKRTAGHRSKARSAQKIVRTGAQILANELPDLTNGESPVQSALYTTDGSERPKGAWLDSSINDEDSDISNR